MLETINQSVQDKRPENHPFAPTKRRKRRERVSVRNMLCNKVGWRRRINVIFVFVGRPQKNSMKNVLKRMKS